MNARTGSPAPPPLPAGVSLAAPTASYTPLILFVSLTLFVVTCDFTMVGIVLPRIGAEFAGTESALSGFVAINALVYASLLMTGGRLADLWGQRRCCAVGLWIFAFGTLSVMAAQSLTWLLAARAVQGAGAALIAPASFALINVAIPNGAQRLRAYRVFGSFQGAAMIGGPVLGGALTTALGWRFAYILEFALTLALLLAIRSIVPRRQTPSTKERFDAPGALLFGAAIILFVAAISGLGGSQLGPRARILAGIAAVIALFWLARVERRSSSPLLPSSVLRQPQVLTASIGMMAAMGASTAFFLLPNVLMQQVLGWTAVAAGLGMLPHAFAAIFAGQATGYMMSRFSLPQNIAIAFGLMILSLCLYAWLPQPTNYVGSILAPMVIGGGASLFSLMVLMADAAAPVPESAQGVVSALAYTSQQVGVAIGAAVLLASVGMSAVRATAVGLRPAFMIAALIALVGLACSVGLRWLLTRRSAPHKSR